VTRVRAGSGGGQGAAGLCPAAGHGGAGVAPAARCKRAWGAIMTSLAGKVALITGASRGIGRALALGLAREGWHVAVAAKSAESTDKLPGSIHSVAREVEALGAQALPVRVDVR